MSDSKQLQDIATSQLDAHPQNPLGRVRHSTDARGPVSLMIVDEPVAAGIRGGK